MASMKLSECLAAYRSEHKISLRSLGKTIGVDFLTLHRFEKGLPIQGDSLVKILKWLIDSKPNNGKAKL